MSYQEMVTVFTILMLLIGIVASSGIDDGTVSDEYTIDDYGYVYYAPVGSFRVLTFNIEVCGTHVVDGDRKIAKHIKLVNPDAVLLQEVEIWPCFPSIMLHLGLKWQGYHRNGSGYPDTGVITRHPIVPGSYHATTWTMGYKIQYPLSRSKNVTIALRSVHTNYRDYGPYAACNKHCTEPRQILAGELSRVDNMKELLNSTHFQQDITNADTVPLIVGGDFNSPSHLDWTSDIQDRHCGWAYSWPASQLLQEHAKLTDAFREMHPDPSKTPGNTWSTVQKGAEGWAYTIPEPQDRIDFIFYKGKRIKARKAQVYNGTEAIAPKPNRTHNDWPSDHSAVVVDFDILY